MCVGFLNLFCWSFALLVTMWVRWRGFAELRLNTAYGNAFWPSTSEERSDSVEEFNTNVAGQLFHPLILTPQCQTAEPTALWWVSGPSGRSQVWFHQKMLAKGFNVANSGLDLSQSKQRRCLDLGSAPFEGYVLCFLRVLWRTQPTKDTPTSAFPVTKKGQRSSRQQDLVNLKTSVSKARGEKTRKDRSRIQQLR